MNHQQSNRERILNENAGKRRTIEIRNASPSSLGSQKQGWQLSSEQGQLEENCFTILTRENIMETPEVFSVNRNCKEKIKRSNIMKNSTIGRFLKKGILAIFTLALVAAVAMGQNLILHGNQTNAGTISVGGNVNNASGSAIVIDGAGIVRLQGATGAITNHDIMGSDISFTNLDMIGSRTTTLKVNTTVLDALRVGFTSNPYTAAGVGFDITGQTLTLGGTAHAGTATYEGTSTAALTFGGLGSKVSYASTSASNQPVLTKTGGVSYTTLDFSGAGTKRVVLGGKVTAATLTHAGGQLSVYEDVDVTGSITALADLGAINTGKTLEIKSGATAVTMTSMNNTGTGIFKNSANIDITIPTLAGNTGQINNAGTGRLSFTNNITNAGTITTATGKLDFNGTGAQTNTGGTISVTGAGEVYFAGDIATTPGTLTLNSASITHFDGATQNIPTGVTYGSLNAEGTGTKTAAGNITVATNLVIDQDISQSSGALTMTSTTPGNVTGTKEVLGAVRRLHNFTTGSDYQFNRADVSIGTATLAASDITLTMAKATDPTTGLPSKYVKRQYLISHPNAGNLQRLQLYWANGELQGGLLDTKVGLRAYSGSWAKVNFGTQVRNSSGNLMTYTGLNNSLTGVSELGMAVIGFRTLADGSLSLPTTWDENTLPTSTDDITIANTVTVGATPLSVATMTIESGKLTTNNAAGTINVSGSTAVTGGELDVATADATLANVDVTGTGKLTVSNGARLLTASAVTLNTSATSIFTGNVSFASLANTAGIVDLLGTSTTVSGAVSNAGTLNVGDGALSSGVTFATTAGQNVTSSGTLAVKALAGLTIGASGAPANNLIITAGSLNVASTTAIGLTVYGDLDIQGGTITNTGSITVAE